MNITTERIDDFPLLLGGLQRLGLPAIIDHHDPDFSVLDLKAYYRGYRYVTETIQMLPQKPDNNLVSQLFHKVAALGRIHPIKEPVSSG